MSNAVVSHPLQPTPPIGMKLAVALVLALWFALVILLGAAEAFVTPPGVPPLPIAVGVTVPIALFLIALASSPAFRATVLALDVRVSLAIQAWRFAGFAFLALYVYDVLPRSFALPAGLGDMAIAVTAPLMLLAVIRRPRFAASKTLAVWNLLGILDLVTAVATGALSSTLATGVPGEITTAPMAQLPLLLIPAYLVPIFVMLHVVALMQARRLARAPGRAA